MPIDKFIKDPNAKAAMSGALGGAASGLLVSAFTNKKSAKKLLKAGGLVALGGVAWHAYQKYQEKNQPGAAVEPPPLEANTPQAEVIPASTPSAGDDALMITDEGHMDEQAFVAQLEDANTATLVLQAMVAAGYADGHLSEAERTRIWQKALEDDLPGDALAELQAMLDAPVSVAALATGATDMKTRIEIYTASQLAMDTECDAGVAHLEQLAKAMAMPPGLVMALNENAS